MVNFNGYLLRYHNDYFKLQGEEKSLYKAENYDVLKKGLMSKIKNSSLKAHPFESVFEEGYNQDIENINNFLLSIGEDNVIVNNDPNAMLFKNILDYDMFNYEVNYKKEYVFDLPWTEIKTANKRIQNYKFSSPIYYLIDSIFNEIINDKQNTKSEQEIQEIINDYLPIMYNDILTRGQLINTAFRIKEYTNNETVITVIVPNERIARKVDFYKFENFIKQYTDNDLSGLESMKNYHKNEILKFLNKKSDNVVLFKRK